MILYQLNCAGDHAFETWFKDADTCDRQLKRKSVECPVCGSRSVSKALMAPRIGKSSSEKSVEILPPVGAPTQVPTADANSNSANSSGADFGGTNVRGTNVGGGEKQMAVLTANLREALGEIRKQVEANCDYVGNKFAEEARKIHYGETEARGIYGEATDEQHKELVEEGVEIARIPWLPRGDA